MNSRAQTAPALQGVGVLVTRPAHQADRLCRLIEAQGGRAIRFPVLEIHGPGDPEAVLAVIDRLDDYDMAIFTSANAVSRALPLIQARRGLPPQLTRVAIGKGSARALARFDAAPHLIPEALFNSEALLAMPELQAIAGQAVVIFRGEGGRALLGNTLRERGAQVTYTEVYRRGKPAADPSELLQRWREGEIHVVTVTSPESLQNLFDMIGESGRNRLCNTPLVVVSRRAQQLACELGFSHTPLLAREASDEAIIEALLNWRPAGFKQPLGTCHDGQQARNR